VKESLVTYNMKVIIQHNFTSGLGDFISDVSQYMTILEEPKNLGYEIHLKISLRSNKYSKGPFFSSLFDDETISFFDSIEETNKTIYELELEGCKYYCSNHHPQIPGQHHYDIFFDEVPPNFGIKIFSAQNIHHANSLPKLFPKPNILINNLVENFHRKLPNEYNFLHIRTSDIIDSNNERYDRIISNVRNFVSDTNENFHLGTNNKYIYNMLKNDSNIFVFEFEYFDLLSNDQNAFTNGWYGNEIEDSVLINRLQSIFAEMVSIEKCSKIYYLYDISWVSNFLFYPMCSSKNKIELINKNLWLN